MDTKKQNQQGDFYLIAGFVYSFFLIAVLVFCSVKLHLTRSELVFFVSLPLTIIFCAVIIWMSIRQRRFDLHENSELSSLIYRVKQIEEGKTVGPEEISELKNQLLDFAKANPETESEVHRYLGDLAFATMETEESLKYYAKALDKLERDSDDYLYVYNRYAAGMLRVRYYDEALREFEFLANTKPFYSIGLGAMYEFGWGVEPDLKKACQLYQQAMRAGNDFAVVNYYEARWRIWNPVPDPDKDGYAEYMFKCHDQEGFKAGVPALTESAEAGYAPSQFELGTLLMHGNLGPNKQAEAFRWLRMSADKNYLPAMHNLGFLIQMRCMDPIKGDINKPKIPGTLLFDGKVRIHSYESGMALIHQAAEAGYPPSQHSIGATYLRDGQNDKAKLWLKRAADQGYKQALDDYENAFGELPVQV